MDIIQAGEDARLAALASYDILDTPIEGPYERIVRLVQKLLDVPIATVTLVDKDRQWFKARRGLDTDETDRDISVCDLTIRATEPLEIEDLREDERFRDSPLIDGDPPILSYLGIPLVNPDGYALGALCAMDSVPRKHSPAHIAILSDLAELVLELLEMRRISRTDFLTGAMTRREFRTRLERRMAGYSRHGRDCAIVLFDVDHFKQINDTYGHGAGDEVLKAVVSECSGHLRGEDIIARLGGEEFCLLLPETDADEAALAADRFRRLVSQIAIPGLPDVAITASFGVAPLLGAYESPEDWVHAADRALYRAKESGRNRCCVASAD
ncbi:MAG: sensor domain-containing diguanylate cyclase [Sphingomonadales bacterium CG12_big_fil_rev_8_21_14_0_65_65_10]|nr:MAG: sensor domain-containing diguanylate cyclase [Sphingomonadales bacterium CG12_big_fil_rev_8_21_14_0_65_65_10]